MDVSKRKFLATGLTGLGAVVLASSIMTGSALALQQTRPVAGVGVRCCKRPGGSSARYVNATTGKDGTFAITGLAPAEYLVYIGTQAPIIVKVGATGILKGTVVSSGGLMTLQDNKSN